MLGILLTGVIAVIAVYFALNLTLISPQIPITNNPPIVTLTDEEYNVYSALISSVSDAIVSNTIKLVVIEENTVGSDYSKRSESNEAYVRQDMPELQQETLDNYKKANQQSYLLERQFDLPVSYILISEKEKNDIFQSGRGWDDFYKKYPASQGIMSLSRVGFNSQEDQALVYIGKEENWEGGRGYIFLLIKENNVWKIKREVIAWIS
jgi:hypothetical protein